MVYRIFVRRRDGFDNEGVRLCDDMRRNLLIPGLRAISVINRYDIEGIGEDVLSRALNTVFSEPQTDIASFELDVSKADRYFIFEYLPGQFDQRADSCEQCIALLMGGIRPRVKSGKVYLIDGDISDEEFARIKAYVINPVEGREASDILPETLADNVTPPTEVETLTGFIDASDGELFNYISKYSLAMDRDDILFCRRYFRDEEHRDPTITELRLIDSYWSDHCRHTTFLTEITSVDIEPEYIKKTYSDYLATREFLYVGKNKPISLMDIATIAAKYLKRTGVLKNLDESEEINACSVKIKATVDGEEQDWLLMFKNETHNHPTEIEPFGGAATCLGGAIRDPLSGRAYVYQAMRVTGAADVRKPISETLPGKLPQSKISLGAAAGYSSYGNQIGLATGGVYEVYHPGYEAKRMEIGAVVGAAPVENVIRNVPEDGDVVILLGGKTGRDGCGGATGSSKAHTADSINECGAEVQKGNPPEERKIQRLFRRGEVTRLIKRCNDFGAGGVSVAIGELADGLVIDLNKVPKKYEGLDGTELAISESQERMAVVVSPENADEFIKYAGSENLDATVVAKVTEEPRLVMNWEGNTIVNLSREFLSSNGAPKKTAVSVPSVNSADILSGEASKKFDPNDIKGSILSLLSDLNVCSQRGLSERFDSSIGAATVVMPFGGKNQLTPPQYMAAKLPTLGQTDTASFMAYGYDPYLSSISPYHGALYATVHSAAKLTSAGLDFRTAYLTYQEYFERTNGKPERWGKPFAALLGAFEAQTKLGLGSIGGKDSMSGTFENIDVPPTLVSFAVAAGKASAAITPEFKSAGSCVYFIKPEYDENGIVCFEALGKCLDSVYALANEGKIKSAYAVGFGGIAEAVAKMSLGNSIGFKFADGIDAAELFRSYYGALVIETDEKLDCPKFKLLGVTADSDSIVIGDCEIKYDEIREAWEGTLEGVFPTMAASTREIVPKPTPGEKPVYRASIKLARPRAVIPVFPGTNCEYDSAKALKAAGADPRIVVLRNYTADALTESIAELTEAIKSAQILMLPGGFSGGDEPDGSGKFITAVLRNAYVREAVGELTNVRDGLVLGICNGFQALLKSGLLPFGEIKDEMSPDDATLTFNTIGRHQSKMVHTRIASVKSPWMSLVDPNETYVIPISHGEGRFIASPELLEQLERNGQIATQYCSADGTPSIHSSVNPNGSYWAIEGIFSPDGRIFGKMGHSERYGENIARNIPGEKHQPIFESGVAYFG